jgi:hypothetical protein
MASDALVSASRRGSLGANYSAFTSSPPTTIGYLDDNSRSVPGLLRRNHPA